MLTLEECERALQLAEQKASLEKRIEAIPRAVSVDFEVADYGGSGTLRFGLGATSSYGIRHGISETTLDGIRTLLLADQRERLAEIERQLKQLVVAP